jgi:hypothetical protein
MNYAIDTSAGTEIVTHTVFAKVQELRTELTALKHDHDRLMDRCTAQVNENDVMKTRAAEQHNLYWRDGHWIGGDRV